MNGDAGYRTSFLTGRGSKCPAPSDFLSPHSRRTVRSAFHRAASIRLCNSRAAVAFGNLHRPHPTLWHGGTDRPAAPTGVLSGLLFGRTGALDRRQEPAARPPGRNGIFFAPSVRSSHPMATILIIDDDPDAVDLVGRVMRRRAPGPDRPQRARGDRAAQRRAPRPGDPRHADAGNGRRQLPRGAPLLPGAGSTFR